jgi:lipoate-protein ligase B
MLEIARPPLPTAAAPLPLAVRWLGRVPYAETLAEQRRLHAARIAGTITDTLLLLEHPPVYTLGRNSDPAAILRSEPFLRQHGATVERSERGGGVTFHGPGQLVAYPIISLGAEERSLRLLVDRLEDVILATLRGFGLEGRRDASDRGIWVGTRKIASIGLAARQWTVLHGTGLNVSTDLSYFTYIDPCGHPGLEMTSMARELGTAPPLSQVAATFVRHFGTVFGRTAVDPPSF